MNTVWLETWPAALADEFLQVFGPFRLIKEGLYWFGTNDPEMLSTDKVAMNVPLKQFSDYVQSCIVAECCISTAGVGWLTTLPLRLDVFEETADQLDIPPAINSHCRSIWQALQLVTSIGFRFPTELEWEAGVIGCTDMREHHLVTHSLRSIPTTSELHTNEVTFSVGFQSDYRLPGIPLNEAGPFQRYYDWPGLIFRGSNTSMSHPLSRWSHRQGFQGMRVRLLLEEHKLLSLGRCPFKTLMLKHLAESTDVSERCLFREYRTSVPLGINRTTP